MNACGQICKFKWTYICLYACVNMYAHINVYTYVCVLCVRVYACVYACMHVCMYICLCVCMLTAMSWIYIWHKCQDSRQDLYSAVQSEKSVSW